jgi:biopolymer transport protein ExbB
MCRIENKQFVVGLLAGVIFVTASFQAMAQAPPAETPVAPSAAVAEVAPVPATVPPSPDSADPAPDRTTGPGPTEAPPEPMAPETGKDESAKTEMSILDYVRTGGWLLYMLAAMSVIGLSFVVYFLFVFTRRNVAPQDFVKDVQMMLSYNRMNEARKACEKSRSPVASIAAAGIDYVEQVDDPDPILLKEILEGEGGRQAASIKTQISYLLDIGVIAPMVGLLGTVFGMLHSFGALALDLTSAKPVELAGGITEALVTTAGGLLVGIPAMLAYAFFRGRASGLISSMELAANEFLVALVGRKR